MGGGGGGDGGDDDDDDESLKMIAIIFMMAYQDITSGNFLAKTYEAGRFKQVPGTVRNGSKLRTASSNYSPAYSSSELVSDAP